MAGSKQSSRRSRRGSAPLVAAKLLAQRFDEVLRRLPPVLDQWQQDSEHVHQLRVAIRRGVTALDLFAELLARKRARWIRRQFQQLRRATDAARDYDVLLSRLSVPGPDQQAVQVVQRLRTERLAAQQPIVELDRQLRGDGALEHHAEKLVARLRHDRRAAAGRTRFKCLAREGLRRQARRFWRAADKDLSALDALHRLRIRGKQLRYSLDLLSDAMPRKLLHRLYAKVIRLQDKLGAINDHAAAREMLQRFADALADPAAAAPLNALLDAEQRGLDAAREAFSAWWTPKRCRALRRQLRRLHQA